MFGAASLPRLTDSDVISTALVANESPLSQSV